MRDATVVALGVVLDGELPVCLNRVGLHCRDLGIGQSIWPQPIVEVLLDSVERYRLIIQVDEHHPVKNPDMRRLEAVITFVEIVVCVFRGPEPAIQFVGPTVVGTHEEFLTAGGFQTDPRTAVSAHVHQCADAVFLTAHDDHRFAGDLEQVIVSDLWNLADVAGVVPRFQKDPVDFTFEDDLVSVETLLE